MATPQIRSVGTSSGTVNNLGRNNLVTGETVTLSDTAAANVGHVHAWSFVDKPQGSAASLTTPSGATSTFQPDVTGSYMVKCVVDGTATRIVVLAVPLPVTGGRIPAFSEALEYDAAGNTKGWHEALTTILRNTDAARGIRETGGPTVLTMGAVADGKVFARVGTTVVGVAGGHVIQNAGAPLTTRANLNYTGGLVASDGGAGPDSNIVKLGGSILRTVYSGVGRDDNDQVTHKIVGAFAFNPADYAITNTTREIKFRVVGAAGNTTVVASVQLYNVTDAAVVTTVTFTGSAATTKTDSALLTVPADLPNSEKLYEVRIFVDTPGGSNICIVYSASLIVTNVVA